MHARKHVRTHALTHTHARTHAHAHARTHTHIHTFVHGDRLISGQAWGQFASELRDFQRADTREAAVHCLNFLITNALQHVVDVLKYMGRIRNQSVFNFCAIPQVSNCRGEAIAGDEISLFLAFPPPPPPPPQTMAIATLAACYNNPRVFEGVVKIRKGQAVAMMVQSTDMTNLRSIMAQFLLEVRYRGVASVEGAWFVVLGLSYGQTLSLSRHVLQCLKSFFLDLQQDRPSRPFSSADKSRGGRDPGTLPRLLCHAPLRPRSPLDALAGGGSHGRCCLPLRLLQLSLHVVTIHCCT